MRWLELKYVSLLESRLRNFKRKSVELYNFSCPLCGDSTRKKSKARGWIYSQDGKLLYHCHNCSVTMSAIHFIKEVDEGLFNEFILERMRETKGEEPQGEPAPKMSRPLFRTDDRLRKLVTISGLPDEHPAKSFILRRMIPEKYHPRMYWVHEFQEWVNTIIPGKFKYFQRGEGRIVIPFFDETKSMHAFQGRSLDAVGDYRYITIVNDETKPKLFGLDELDMTKRIQVVEGPLDSMFLSNGVATAGGDLVSATKTLSKKNLIIIYDCEPRSRETVNKLTKAVYAGYSVVIWPVDFPFKDINEAIINDWSINKLRGVLNENIYSGLAAQMALTSWKKV